MRIVPIDLLNGYSMQVIVTNEIDAIHLQKFLRDADMAFADQERWVKVSALMTHEHAGPNVGWTLGMVLPGDDPDEAADNILGAA